VTTPLVSMLDIHRTYVMGDNLVHALAGVNLTIEKGESIAIMGTSGSGKSTMMNIMGCLDQPTKGKYLLNGKDVSKLSRAQLADVRGRMIGFVFQSFNLLSRTSALENVEMPLMYQGVPARERLHRARVALERVGLKERLRARQRLDDHGVRGRDAVRLRLSRHERRLLSRTQLRPDHQLPRRRRCLRDDQRDRQHTTHGQCGR
jgi:putative ABC transport system ATP-binding protein